MKGKSVKLAKKKGLRSLFDQTFLKFDGRIHEGVRRGEGKEVK